MPLILEAVTVLAMSLLNNPVEAGPLDGDAWVVSGGLGVVSASRSIGSGRQLTLPVPLIEGRYREWFYATDNPYEGIGVTQKLGDRWSVSAALGVDLDTRDPGEDAHVRGLPKVGIAPALRLRSSYDSERWFASLTAAERLASASHRGFTLSAEAGWNAIITERWLGSLGLVGRMMDRRWAESFLAVSPSESRLSGLSVHDGRAGFLDDGVFAQAVVRLNDRWTLFSRLQYVRFTSSAAASPVISHRSTPVGLLFVSRVF